MKTKTIDEIKVTKYSYIDNNGILIEFLPIYNTISTCKTNILYQQVINGILMDNKYNIDIIHNLMNNGYKWEIKEILIHK